MKQYQLPKLSAKHQNNFMGDKLCDVIRSCFTAFESKMHQSMPLDASEGSYHLQARLSESSFILHDSLNIACGQGNEIWQQGTLW